MNTVRQICFFYNIEMQMVFPLHDIASVNSIGKCHLAMSVYG